MALGLAGRHPDWRILALDNLRRRGSELNLPRLRDAGVEFRHGDVREPTDLLGFDALDAVVECSAEPSALAGADGNPLRSQLQPPRRLQLPGAGAPPRGISGVPVDQPGLPGRSTSGPDGA